MGVYTFTSARQNLAKILDEAEAKGDVFIRRRNGRMFVVKLVDQPGSGLDVAGVDVDAKPGETGEWLEESRRKWKE